MNEVDRLLLVTVNSKETKAVLTAFEVATGKVATLETLDGRVYRDLGSIGSLRIFHALSEMGSSSIGASQQTVDKAIRALKPTILIAVGIAFGVNEKKQKIGNILVSRQLMLYEMQRVGSSATISRGDKVHASSRLVNLFEGVAQSSWQGQDVHLGVLLTGEKLVDNIDYREALLKLESEAIGGEMEGAGVYVASSEHKVDWIVVKSICDWADGEKNKNKSRRQSDAAVSAATFVAYALSAVYQSSHTSTMGKILKNDSSQTHIYAPLADRAILLLEDLVNVVQQYQFMHSSYISYILNKNPRVTSEFEDGRLELDMKMVDLSGKLQIYIPVGLRQVVNRIRRIASCSWQEPRQVYYELLQASGKFPREPIEAAQLMLLSLVECLVDASFELAQGNTSSASCLSVMHKHGLDLDANPAEPSPLTTVARVVILEHEYFRANRLTALDEYASMVGGQPQSQS